MSHFKLSHNVSLVHGDTLNINGRPVADDIAEYRMYEDAATGERVFAWRRDGRADWGQLVIQTRVSPSISADAQAYAVIAAIKLEE